MSSEEARQAHLGRVAPAFQSLGSVGAFGFVVLVLMAIALPGARGVRPSSAITAMGVCLVYSLSGVLLGAVGRRLCLATRHPRERVLRVVAWMSLLHLPFGTLAGVRTLLALRAPGR